MDETISFAKKIILDCKSLFITGNSGSGKTHLAIGLMYFYLESFPDKKRPVFLSSVDFFISPNSFSNSFFTLSIHSRSDSKHFILYSYIDIFNELFGNQHPISPECSHSSESIASDVLSKSL